MEIKSSRVSVYEVEVDIKHWDARTTAQVPGFAAALLEALPTTARHRCMAGEPGGFLAEVRRGTDFAHVVEHVLVELIRLAHPEREFSGWTRAVGDGTSVIHYGAPDFLTGRLAAILAVDLVKALIAGDRLDADAVVEQLRHPLDYFARADGEASVPAVDLPTLTPAQVANLRDLLAGRLQPLTGIETAWRASFRDFGGTYAGGIVDKLAVLNVDRFDRQLAAGDFAAYFRGVRNLSRLIWRHRIPLTFVVHAAWLYKNHLLLAALEALAGRRDELATAVKDLDDFYQIVLRNIVVAYASPYTIADGEAVREFRELRGPDGIVLVVDDDEMVRQVTCDLLASRGYRALAAEDGRQALAIAARHADEIAVVLLDLVLPNLGGAEVGSRLRHLCPRARIVISSGYPAAVAERKWRGDPRVTFLAKPYRIEDLVAAVRSGGPEA